MFKKILNVFKTCISAVFASIQSLLTGKKKMKKNTKQNNVSNFSSKQTRDKPANSTMNYFQDTCLENFVEDEFVGTQVVNTQHNSSVKPTAVKLSSDYELAPFDPRFTNVCSSQEARLQCAQHDTQKKVVSNVAAENYPRKKQSVTQPKNSYLDVELAEFFDSKSPAILKKANPVLPINSGFNNESGADNNNKSEAVISDKENPITDVVNVWCQAFSTLCGFCDDAGRDVDMYLEKNPPSVTFMKEAIFSGTSNLWSTLMTLPPDHPSKQPAKSTWGNTP